MHACKIDTRQKSPLCIEEHKLKSQQFLCEKLLFGRSTCKLLSNPVSFYRKHAISLKFDNHKKSGHNISGCEKILQQKNTLNSPWRQMPSKTITCNKDKFEMSLMSKLF